MLSGTVETANISNGKITISRSSRSPSRRGLSPNHLLGQRPVLLGELWRIRFLRRFIGPFLAELHYFLVVRCVLVARVTRLLLLQPHYDLELASKTCHYILASPRPRDLRLSIIILLCLRHALER